MSFATRHWYRLSPVSVLLYPLSLVFRIVVACRRALYRRGVLRSERLPVPVIVVGNLTVGGTGKTPLVLALAAALRRQGLRPGIVTRGYGGAGSPPRRVRAEDDPARAGDEPVLLARRSGCAVWVGADRVAAASGLLQEGGCDVILCDDGLQHYRLRRDVEIAVEDERGVGNGWLLPAGPLREPATRAVDATVLNGLLSRPGVYPMRLRHAGFFSVGGEGEPVSPTELADKRLHAVAGIGNPDRFFAHLSGLGLTFAAHAFPDHHPFRAEDLDFPDCDFILMTEKDAVKCAAFGRRDLVAARVDAELDPALTDLILQRIHGRPPA